MSPKIRKTKPPRLHLADLVGEGPPVVMLHGIASSSVTFQNVIPLLEGTHRCIAVDLLGFGESPIPEDGEYTIGEHAEAIHQTLKKLKLREPAILIGHSMGALIAARLAATYPKKISKVVLVSPPIYLAPAQLTSRRDRQIMDFYLRAYHYLRENPRFTLRAARTVERFLSIPKAMDINERTWVPFIKSLEHSIESQTTINDIAATKAPIEIVYGNFDQFHSEGVLKIVGRMHGVRVHRVRGSDHLIGKRLARAVAVAAVSVRG
ncbi:alpha/beta fold hydrolase [Frondihabitans cladoniiphilus]|uniref:alpha/beta fold hydrolase n=1 Tax=Frondihabitans cladoniiphilus TaxID=715785 RepID=UPI0031EC22AC